MGDILKGKGRNLNLRGQRVSIWAMVLSFGLGIGPSSHAQPPLNTITIHNQSGQVAEVKVMGPSKQFVKVPLDGKRTVHVRQGKYYLLVRYGFSPKEYVYTKSEPFIVNEPDGKYSRITFTLHRMVSPNPSAQRVSGDEFENATLTE